MIYNFFRFHWNKPPNAEGIGHGCDRSLSARSYRLAINKNTYLYVCSFFDCEKKNNLTQVGAPNSYIFPVYTITRNNIKRCGKLHMKKSENWNKERLFKALIWQSRQIYNVGQNIIFLLARKLQQLNVIGETGSGDSLPRKHRRININNQTNGALSRCFAGTVVRKNSVIVKSMHYECWRSSPGGEFSINQEKES